MGAAFGRATTVLGAAAVLGGSSLLACDRLFGAEILEGLPRDGLALAALLILASMTLALWNAGTIIRRAPAPDRRDLLERAAETRERLAAIVDSSSDAIMGGTPAGIVTSWNHAAERIFGYTASEMIGRSVSVLIPDDRIDDMRNSRDQLAAGESVPTYETVRLHKDGRLVDVAISVSPICDPSGEIVAVSMIARDVTERKRIEAKFCALLESAPSAMVIADQNGRIVLANALTESLFQYRREELVGHSFELLMPERDRAKMAAQRRDGGTARWPAGASHELHGLRKDGTEFPIEVSQSTLEAADGHLVSTAIRDVSQAKRREAELVAARAEADVANRAKSDFISRMSHELRTPLNAVIGYAQMLELDRQDTLTETQKEYCGHILSSSNHLLGLVNEVLDLAQIEAGKLHLSLERINVATALTEIEKMMSPIAGRAGVKLTIGYPSGVPDIQADDLRLRQVLVNLVSNAIKYNRSGGAVTVSARVMTGNRVRLVVTDSGFGIGEEQKAHLFDPFARSGAEHANIEGIGLGLAISRRLVEAMHGAIGFKSARGKGSTFWVELPVDAAAPVHWAGRIDATTRAIAPLATSGDYSILYVDDNLANLRLMERIISTLPDVALLTARSPQLGLDLAVAHRPDVIVLDVNLPGMSGYDIVARLKAMPETCNIPVLALSAAISAGTPQRSLAAGFFRYLTKPIDVKAFLGAIDQALAGSATRRAGNG